MQEFTCPLWWCPMRLSNFRELVRQLWPGWKWMDHLVLTHLSCTLPALLLFSPHFCFPGLALPNKVLACKLLTQALFPGHPSLRQQLSYLVSEIWPKHLAVSISDRFEQIQHGLHTCAMLLSWWHRRKLLVHQPKIVSTRYNQFSRVFCSIQLDDMQDGICKNCRWKRGGLAA